MWIGELGTLVRDRSTKSRKCTYMYSKRMTKSKRVSSVRELKERKESLQVENANPWTCFSPVGGEQGKNVRPPSSPLWNPFQPHHSLFFFLVCVFILPIDSRLLVTLFSVSPYTYGVLLPAIYKVRDLSSNRIKNANSDMQVHYDPHTSMCLIVQ